MIKRERITKKRIRNYLYEIRDIVEQFKIETLSDFTEEFYIKYAVTQLMTNIVELDKTIKNKHKVIGRKYVEIRNLASHSYSNVDYKVVWDFAVNRVPVYIERVEKQLKVLDNKLKRGR